MPAGPAHWGSYAGETLEKVMAVLVAQDFPDVRRRTPSSGDGGVDLYRLMDGGYHVTQVKGFAGRLGNNQKRQIKKSFERLTSNPRLDQPVVEVVFTGPTDLTEGEQRWFEELVAGAPFPCTWEGEVAWNGPRRAASLRHRLLLLRWSRACRPQQGRLGRCLLIGRRRQPFRGRCLWAPGVAEGAPQSGGSPTTSMTSSRHLSAAS